MLRLRRRRVLGARAARAATQPPAAAAPAATPAAVVAPDAAPAPAAAAAPARAGPVDRARSALASVRSAADEPALLAALDALEEAVDVYARDLGSPGESQALRARLAGVVTLARTCGGAAADDHAARAALGAAPAATPAEVWALADALTPLYAGPTALPGADPTRAAALEAAAARLAGQRPAQRRAA